MARDASLPGYGHSVSYCCVARVFRFRFPLTLRKPSSGLVVRVIAFGLWPSLPILAEVCGVCFWVRNFSSSPRSWLAFSVRVLRDAFRLHAAISGSVFWCVYSRADFAFTLPIVAGVSVVCVPLRLLLVPRQSNVKFLLTVVACGF